MIHTCIDRCDRCTTTRRRATTRGQISRCRRAPAPPQRQCDIRDSSRCRLLPCFHSEPIGLEPNSMLDSVAVDIFQHETWTVLVNGGAAGSGATDVRGDLFWPSGRGYQPDLLTPARGGGAGAQRAARRVPCAPGSNHEEGEGSPVAQIAIAADMESLMLDFPAHSRAARKYPLRQSAPNSTALLLEY